jgi:hypothetical protein
MASADPAAIRVHLIAISRIGQEKSMRARSGFDRCIEGDRYGINPSASGAAPRCNVK